MGMDDVIAGGGKEREGKRWWGGGGAEKRRTGLDMLLARPPRESIWNPPAHRKGHGATRPYILITKEPSL